MACDEAGAWTTLPEQPVSPGTPFWVGLGAGNTWLAAVPREPQQEISIATMVPDSPGAAAA
jgi:hypothetical protein